MSPYRTPPSRAIATSRRRAPVTWQLAKFHPLDEHAWCARCGAQTGGQARLCLGEGLLWGLWWLCPRVPHFHVTCAKNERHKHPCGHLWLMATADAPNAREAYGGGLLQQLGF